MSSLVSNSISHNGFLRTEVDKAKNCCRIGCTQPLSGPNRVTARGFNRAPAAWMRMQKKSAVITAKAKRNHAHRFDTPHRISAVDYW